MPDFVFVIIRLPAAGKTYEVRMPLGLNAQVAARLAGRALSAMPDSLFQPDRGVLLAWQKDGIPLDQTKTLEENKVINGTRLLLI